MSCKHYEEQIIEYLDGQLQATQVATLEAHLNKCAACSAEFAATREALAALDDHLAEPPKMDVEASLAAVRSRLRAEEPANRRDDGWSASLRWWLGGGLVAATAAGLLAIALNVPDSANVKPVTPSGQNPPGLASGLPPRAEAAAMMDFLEQMPLYENLDCFKEYDHLAAMLEEDPERLEEILREVQG